MPPGNRGSLGRRSYPGLMSVWSYVRATSFPPDGNAARPRLRSPSPAPPFAPPGWRRRTRRARSRCRSLATAAAEEAATLDERRLLLVGPIAGEMLLPRVERRLFVVLARERLLVLIFGGDGLRRLRLGLGERRAFLGMLTRRRLLLGMLRRARDRLRRLHLSLLLLLGGLRRRGEPGLIHLGRFRLPQVVGRSHDRQRFRL